MTGCMGKYGTSASASSEKRLESRSNVGGLGGTLVVPAWLAPVGLRSPPPCAPLIPFFFR
eukprot:3363996-Amphidinium_carterae.2